MQKAKPYLVTVGALAVSILILYFLGEIILPFFIALLGAYFSNIHVRRLQKIIPKRDFAVTAYLVLVVAVGLGTVVLFGAEFVQDIKRLNGALTTFASNHQEEIEGVNDEIRSYIELIYTNEDLQASLSAAKLDSTGSEYLTDALSGITSFLGGGSEEAAVEKTTDRSINWLVVLFTSIGYYSLILYTFGYFEEKFEKYFGKPGEGSGGIAQFIADFRRIFLDYLNRRTWIVLICTAIFTTTFLIINIPGAIFLGILSGLLCYIAHFHYLALLPLALASFVRAIEAGQHFFLFYGIAIGVCILVSILEEAVLYPKFMEGISSLNPAIFALFIAIWIYIFGGIVGTFIALPLTTALLIYMDRLLLFWKQQREIVAEDLSD